ncbi:MAG: hypothetical protein V3U92_04500 [Cellulophaga sp.]
MSKTTTIFFFILSFSIVLLNAAISFFVVENASFVLLGYSYLFFILFSWGSLLVFNKVVSIAKEKSGFIFIGTMLLKILFILFFLTALEYYVGFDNIFLLNFAIIYLLFLFLSMFIALKVLKEFD